jgi:large subunit ribosomal protein L7/L12
MAKLNREDFIAALKEMTILEIKELVDAMKDEFGIDPTAVAVAAPGAGAAEDAGPSEVDVIITSGGAAKIKVIKAVRELTGLGLKEAKALVDNGGAVKEKIAPEQAEEIKAQLEELGASIEVK